MSDIKARVENGTGQRLVVLRAVGRFDVRPKDLEPHSSIEFEAGSEGNITWVVDGTNSGVSIDWNLPVIGFDTRHEHGDDRFDVEHWSDADVTVWSIGAKPVILVDDPCVDPVADFKRLASIDDLMVDDRIDVIATVDAPGSHRVASGTLQLADNRDGALASTWSGTLSECRGGAAAATWNASITKGVFRPVPGQENHAVRIDLTAADDLDLSAGGTEVGPLIVADTAGRLAVVTTMRHESRIG